MEATYALSLDNWFCTPTTVDTRGGTSNWATGFSGQVETVMHYNSATAAKLFAACVGSIFDISSSGSIGAAVVTGKSNARWQSVNVTTPGGWFLMAANGADSVLIYDGSSWANASITGVTSANLVHVNVFKNRVYFTEINTMNAWYLPVNSIAGAATKFPLSSIFTRGGYLMAMLTWTIDNTSGVDDYAVFITSEGEVAIYQGYDPDFASSWTLVGVFFMGRPIGRRCFTKMGSDNAVICADGVVALSKELTTDRDISQSLSYNILNLINNDVAAYNANFGWQPVYYPIGNKLIINVPAMEGAGQYQYVMNTITGAWSSWGKLNSPIAANCWDVFEDNIYYGGNGVVAQADLQSNTSDNGVAIQTDMKPAFSYFGELGTEKYFTMARPIFLSTDPITPSYVLCLDYNDVLPVTPQGSIGTGSPWDTSPWDVTPWGASGYQVNKNWLTVGGVGYAASLRMATLTNGVSASLQSIDYVYETGGVL